MTVRLTYDAGADAAYIYLKSIGRREAVRQHLIDAEATTFGEIVLDFDKDDRLLGIEVLGASRVLPPELLDRAERSS